MEIGNKIAEFRKKENLSQEQLAEKIDVTRQTISKWELGETNPNIEQAKKLAKVFKVSLDELTGNSLETEIIDKVAKTEKMTKVIVKLSIVTTILSSIIILCIVLFIASTFIYFRATPVYQGIEFSCYLPDINEKFNYNIKYSSSEKPKIMAVTGEEVIPFENYDNPDTLYRDINNYYLSLGGKCG